MATVFRVLLWVLVLLAPGGILLAPVLAAHELRRRSANGAKNGSASAPSVESELLPAAERLSVAAVASVR